MSLIIKFMKQIFLLFILSFFLLSCKTENKKNDDDASFSVYYFHPTARCESCINIENFTKELIETKYSSASVIKYISLNIDESKNEHFKKDYSLKFSSVIISKHKNGIEEKYKNLDSIWTYSSNKEGFFKYMDSEIKEFIK